MALRIGIVGIGFMGRMHFGKYQGIPGAKVAAICDIDPKKRAGDWSSIGGNIGGAGKRTDLRGIRVYSDARRMFADPGLDVVDITLPTFLHARYAVMALKAGKHVICEKPIAINSREAARMVKAARKSGRKLFVAQCIRFWPHYAVAQEIVKSGKYGKVVSAVFRRLSSTPTWSWKNWLQDPGKSGVAALDLHIHDTDFVLYCFGKPRTVSSHYAGLGKRRPDHIVTSFGYGPGKMVLAEGAWEYAAGYPFSMSFTIAMERATLDCPPTLQMKLHLKKGGTKDVKVPAGDGWGHELAHFIGCLRKKRASKVVTPEGAMESVKLVEAEVKSALTGKPVRVKF